MSSLQKYRKVKILGKGSYGSALLVELKANPAQKFVMKEIIIGHLKPQEQKAAKSEAEVLHQMSHSNITMYIESFVEGSKLYIVMEHADGGDLTNAIQRRKTSNKKYPEEEMMRIFVQICFALKHVHDQNILHRDLKSQNIFLTSKGIVKLGDFGIAKVLDSSGDQARTQIGTPYYLSPEICENKPYGRKSDVWSLGVVLYELAALEMPFQAQSLPALVMRICGNEPSYSKIQGAYSAPMVDLLKSMLQKKPDARPSVKHIVRTEYITSHISQLLSFTLTSGNGGADMGLNAARKQGLAAAAAAGGQRPSEGVGRDNSVLDPEVAERNIERARQAQLERERNREKEAKEAQYHAEREKIRADGHEQLRRIKQEQMRKQNNEGAAGLGDDGDVTIVVAAPSRVPGPAPVVAPISVQQQGDYQRAYMQRQSSQQESAQQVSQKQQQQQQQQAISQQQAHQNPRAGAGSGRERSDYVDANGPSSRKERSLAELQAERRREAERLKEQIEGPNAMGGAVQRQSSVGSVGGGGYDMVVASGRRRSENEFESAASREYWASRAVAQAAKARVEQGPFASQQPTTGQHAGRAAPTGMNQRGNGYGDESTRRSDNVNPEERIAMLKAEKERARDQELAERQRELQQAHEANREQRRNLEEKLRREKQSLAFNVDMSPASGGGQVRGSQKQPPQSDLKEERRMSADDIPSSDMRLINPNILPPSKYAPSPQRSEPTAELTPKSGNANARKKWETPISAEELKMVAAGGVAAVQPVAQPVPQRPKSVMKDEDDEDYDMDQLATLKQGAFYKARVRDGRRGSDSDSGDDRDQPSARDARRSDADSGDDSSPWPNQKESAVDGPIAQDLRDQEQAVLSRLQLQERRQQAARAEAKEAFRRLREQRRLRAANRAPTSGATAAGAPSTPTSAVSNKGSRTPTSSSPMPTTLDSSESGTVVPIRRRSRTEDETAGTPSSQQRLDSILGSVAKARQVVDQVVADVSTKQAPRRAAAVLGDPSDSELDSNLDKYLEQHKDNVTVRRKDAASSSRDSQPKSFPVIAVEEKKRLGGGLGAKGYDDRDQAKAIASQARSDIDVEDSSAKGTEGDGEGGEEDADVAGLQAMLANALMSNGDDDDDDDDYGEIITE